MNIDNAITIETFSNRVTAEMAEELLVSEGIEVLFLPINNRRATS